MMEWFKGSVANAIAQCRQTKALFIVYVHGKCVCVQCVFSVCCVYVCVCVCVQFVFTVQSSAALHELAHNNYHITSCVWPSLPTIVEGIDLTKSPCLVYSALTNIIKAFPFVSTSFSQRIEFLLSGTLVASNCCVEKVWDLALTGLCHVGCLDSTQPGLLT